VSAKRPGGKSRKAKVSVEPARLAVLSMERLKEALERAGKPERFGPPATMLELVARSNVLGRSLPPSYAAAMKVGTDIGEPELLLDADAMRTTIDALAAKQPAPDLERYVPFARQGETVLCFDLASAQGRESELAIAEWDGSAARNKAAHFGEWIDAVADRREEALEAAARVPPPLRRLLDALGFRFEDGLVGRLETGDVEAIEELVGREAAREIRGQRGRLFDSSGKAALVLNLDDFSLAVSLRTGVFVYEPEDVFRWLRWFRDENFFGVEPTEPSHPDRARDLRRAPREPALVLRGVSDAVILPAKRHAFHAAAGAGPDDFWLLGRTASTQAHAPSLLLHVVRGAVETSVEIDEPLVDLHVTRDGTVWALSHAHAAIRFAGGKARAFPLKRTHPGRPVWYGIGGAEGRVLVWGAASLLEFDGTGFHPFVPEPTLEPNETVVSLHTVGGAITMLVTSDQMGAVARCVSDRWLPIREEQVIEAPLLDMDVWRGVAVLLTRDAQLWRMEGLDRWDEARPRRVVWDLREDAFLTDGGALRPLYGVRGFDGGALLATNGGFIATGTGDPVFHRAPEVTADARICRVGEAPETSGLVVVCGPVAWRWRKGEPEPIDLRGH
jgi:hypothetical protein